jgi:hypothetical protein
MPPLLAATQVRARVRSLKVRLDTGLAALQASVEGNTGFAASHLRELGALCQPLLASPISGECMLVWRCRGMSVVCSK